MYILCDPGESIDKYITDLRLKVKTCEYGTMADEMIKDRIVVWGAQ